MISIDNMMVYISIATIYIISPGPAVFIAINYGIMHGFKKTMLLLLGNTIGLGILAAISATGVGILVVNSPLLSAVLSLLGAIFLFYLGYKMIRGSKRRQEVQSIEIESKNGIYFLKAGLLLSLTNPKPIIFFTSIYPQFIDSSATNIVYQFTTLAVIFMFISFFSLNFYSLLAKYVLGNFLDTKRIQVFNIVSGSILIVLAILLLVSKL